MNRTGPNVRRVTLGALKGAVMATQKYPEYKCHQCKIRRRQKTPPSLWTAVTQGWLCHFCTGKAVRPTPRYVIQPSADLEWEFGLAVILEYQFD